MAELEERFYGFDLGDAESAIARLKDGDSSPEILPVKDRGNFITAYARTDDGRLLIGEGACYETSAKVRKVRFKSRFLTDPAAEKDMRAFAGGVLGELYDTGALVRGDGSVFYVGCPAGWDANTRERYREIFEDTGYPPAKIVSESRAALISACRSNHLQLVYDILTKPMLVIDMGSSTTDFAYISGGKEQQLKTAGEVFLGGGVMDEILLEESVSASAFSGIVRRVLNNSDPWRNYAEFAARKLKEKYFSDEEYWKEHRCTQTVTLRLDVPVRLTLRIDEKIADRLQNKRVPQLDGRSFREVFMESLANVKQHIGEEQPELIFLTGGVSKMPSVRGWCIEAFPDAVVIRGSEPEFSVARGLAWTGLIEKDIKVFRGEIAELAASDAVENIVREHIDDLYRRMVDALVNPLIAEAALPVFARWRSGEIRKLGDCDAEIEAGIASFLQSEEARKLLEAPIADWLGTVAGKIEEITIPICVRHNIPYTALSLSSYLSLTDVKVGIDAKGMFAVEEITWLINTIISIIIGLLCGGSGIALIAQGPVGIITGAAASLLVLLLGKDKMEEALLKAELPNAIRHAIPKNYFESRSERIAGAVKASFLENLESEKNEEITGRMVDDISHELENCLIRMAEVVEIPLA